jgi:hypothetical protein
MVKLFAKGQSYINRRGKMVKVASANGICTKKRKLKYSRIINCKELAKLRGKNVEKKKDIFAVVRAK